MDPIFKFNEYSLDTNYVPGIMLGTKNTKMRNRESIQMLTTVSSEWWNLIYTLFNLEN